MKVIELTKSNFRDIPATLRRIADDIEAYNFERVEDAVIVLQGDQLNVFHTGRGDVGSAYMLLGCAKRKIEHAVLSKTGGYKLDNDG